MESSSEEELEEDFPGHEWITPQSSIRAAYQSQTEKVCPPFLPSFLLHSALSPRSHILSRLVLARHLLAAISLALWSSLYYGFGSVVWWCCKGQPLINLCSSLGIEFFLTNYNL